MIARTPFILTLILAATACTADVPVRPDGAPHRRGPCEGKVDGPHTRGTYCRLTLQCRDGVPTEWHVSYVDPGLLPVNRVGYDFDGDHLWDLAIETLDDESTCLELTAHGASWEDLHGSCTTRRALTPEQAKTLQLRLELALMDAMHGH